MEEPKTGGLTYAAAGVDISAGNRAVELFKPHVRKTMRPEMLAGLGGFGGLFALDLGKFKQPVLVSGTDGVGTKLRVAMMMDKHDTIGIDAVAMCVNDILVSGAEPLFFLDYLATGKVIPEKVAGIVKGIADGCLQAGCALIGGETAEMPGFYDSDDYDIAGFSVGAVDRDRIVDGSTIRSGDAVIGLASSGVHSNGFSLIRRVFLSEESMDLGQQVPELGTTLGEALLTPTRIYVKSILGLLDQVEIRGMAHITGGGLVENPPRMLPEGVGVRLYTDRWTVPPVFRLLQKLGQVAEQEMRRTYNMGIGFMVVVPAEQADQAVAYLREQGETAAIVGEIVAGPAEVEFV